MITGRRSRRGRNIATTTTTTRAEVQPEDLPPRASSTPLAAAVPPPIAELSSVETPAASEPSVERPAVSSALRRAPPCANYEDLRTLKDLSEMGDNYERCFDLDEVRDLTTKLGTFKNVMKGLHASWKAPTQTHTQTQVDARTISTTKATNT